MTVAQAKNVTITNLDASASTTTVSVTGQADEDMTAVMVQVLTADSNQVLKMYSLAVDLENKFSGKFSGLSLQAGTQYIVRAADYEGGTWKTVTVTVPTLSPGADDNNGTGNPSDPIYPSDSNASSNPSDSSISNPSNPSTPDNVQTGVTTKTETSVVVNENGIKEKITYNEIIDEKGTITYTETHKLQIGTTEVKVLKQGGSNQEETCSAALTINLTDTSQGETDSNTETKSNQTATLSSNVLNQIQESADSDEVNCTVNIVSNGNTLYKIKVNTKNLTAGNTLYQYQKTKTGYTMVGYDKIKVDQDGNVTVTAEKNATYELVTADKADDINQSILATVKVRKSSAKLKPGKFTIFSFDRKLDDQNVKKITYTSSDKQIVKVSKSGKITASKKGTATIKAKVTLLNGKTKTVRMTIKV